MELFPCPYLDGDVECIKDREAHIAERHPDLHPGGWERISATLEDPDQVRRSVRFLNARLFSRWYDVLGKHVVVVVLDEPSGRHWIITAYIARKYLNLRYDREADILHIDSCPPYAGQESEELRDEVIARLNPDTGEVENIEVLFFSTRLLRSETVELPITATMRLTE